MRPTRWVDPAVRGIPEERGVWPGRHRSPSDNDRVEVGRIATAALLAWILLLGLHAPVDGQVDAQDPPDESSLSPGSQALEEIADAFLRLRTFEAEFEQTQEWVGQDETPTYRGTLYLMRPNLFRIEYREPKGHLQVSDGETVWTYVPENGEVLATRLSGAAGEGGDLLRWVLEEGIPEPATDEDRLDGREMRVVSLRLPEGVGVARVRIWTPPGSSKIMQYEVTDTAGNRSTYRLLKVRENPVLDRSRFVFQPPPGVPVVELGAP